VQYSNGFAERSASDLAKLSSVEQLALVDDVFALANAGLAPLSDALHLISSFSFPVEFTVLSTLAGNIMNLISIHENQSYVPKLKKFILSSLSCHHDRYQWNVIRTSDLLVYFVGHWL